jgi:multidrug efflux pump
MKLSEVFIHRPVATALLTLGIALAGAIAFKLLPAAPMPQVEFPVISVTAAMPGASPETMASTVATPLERSLGAIAGVNEITSSSTLGNTRVTLQFDLSRNIDGAARDVQAAINASRTLLPSNLPSNPTYRKSNPADAPILILSLTSESHTSAQMYDAASTILAQKISQIYGIGQVSVGGSSLPSVRVELNPMAMSQLGIGIAQAQTAVTNTNANRPKGVIESEDKHWQVIANDQAMRANDYMPVIVSYKSGAAVRLQDIADIQDSVQDVRNAGIVNDKPAVMLILYRQPGANIIDTVKRVTDMLPLLKASIPSAMNLDVVVDRSPTIRSALVEVEKTLLISIVLVIAVVMIFLRSTSAALIPSVVVPVSLVGTFGLMYLMDFSLNTLSLMALTIATGFVVDDAVVVIENTMRHIENGMAPFEAAIKGTREVSFTVVTMSLSLIAVFIPILLMGGIVGRLFREFAFTLSVSILLSMVLSLVTTPAMCARLLKPHQQDTSAHWFAWSEKLFDKMLAGYRSSLEWALKHGKIMMVLLLVTIGLNFKLYGVVPKGFFPQQDVGRMMGAIQADQSISFQAMREKMAQYVSIIHEDPAVSDVAAFTGSGQTNMGFVFVALKPLNERKISIDDVIARLRPKIARVAGSSLFLQAQQDVRIGGRSSNAQYQYTLQADNTDDLRTWAPRVQAALMKQPDLLDMNSDQQDKGQQVKLQIDHNAASRLGISTALIDATLNGYFGQNIVSTIYNPLNQYRVVMEAAPQYWQSPEILKNIFITTTGANNMPVVTVPLSSVASWQPASTPLAVNHQSQFAAVTFSFNLPAGKSLSDAAQVINQATTEIGLPSTIQGSFQGTAKAFVESLSTMPLLIGLAILTIYIVLGMLYESLVHPITILSTLPSAGVGALLALIVSGTELSVIAFIGVILLIGIVKKNAIMMIDFAIDAERRDHLTPEEAIKQACFLRFRPIMMTTMAALLGAIPLAIGGSDGSEFRKPLGIAIVGGLILSQMLTLYTTPVVYLYLDRARLWYHRRRAHNLAS